MSNQEPAPQVAQTQPPVKPQGKKPALPPRARRNWDVEKRVFLLFAALSGFWWVALGAMAGHGLFSEGLHAEYFDKAHRYQIVHTLALLVLIALPQRLSPLLCRSAGFCGCWVCLLSAAVCMRWRSCRRWMCAPSCR